MVDGGPSTEISRKVEANIDVTVKQVGKSEFCRVSDSVPGDDKGIEMYEWIDTDGKGEILNKGAGPCLILYVVDRKTGRVMSGHFPQVSRSEVDGYIKEDIEKAQKWYPKVQNGGNRIEIPQNEYLAENPGDTSFDKFMEMGKVISEMVKGSGKDNVDVYLFGNNSPAIGSNPTEYALNIAKSALEQNEVSFELYKMGVPYVNQHDYRVPGQDNTDDTYYSPSERTIYHCVSDRRDNGKFWMRK